MPAAKNAAAKKTAATKAGKHVKAKGNAKVTRNSAKPTAASPKAPAKAAVKPASAASPRVVHASPQYKTPLHQKCNLAVSTDKRTPTFNENDYEAPTPIDDGEATDATVKESIKVLKWHTPAQKLAQKDQHRRRAAAEARNPLLGAESPTGRPSLLGLVGGQSPLPTRLSVTASVKSRSALSPAGHQRRAAVAKKQRKVPLLEVDLSLVAEQEAAFLATLCAGAPKAGKGRVSTGVVVPASADFAKRVEEMASIVQKAGLLQATFHLAVAILRVVVAKTPAADLPTAPKDRKLLHHVVVMLSSKMEEMDPLVVEYCTYETRAPAAKVAALERSVAGQCGFRFNFPTAFGVMDMLFLAGNVDSAQQQWSSALCDVAAAHLPPSDAASDGAVVTAFACVQVAALALGRKQWRWSLQLAPAYLVDDDDDGSGAGGVVGFSESRIHGRVPTDAEVFQRGKQIATAAAASITASAALWNRYAADANGGLAKKAKSVDWTRLL